jgi:Amt family ammonium transporter
MSMILSRWLRSRYLALGVVFVLFGVLVVADPAASQDETSADSKPAASAAAEAAPAAPAPPDYFNGNNPDPKNPKYPDPAGGNAGTWATPAPGGDNPATMTVPELYDRVAHNLFSINMMWTLLAGALVMFMQAGFALVETGLCRAKNAAHTSAMNFMIYPLGCVAFWAYGFAIGWGNWYNAPVPTPWYSSLGPGTVALNEGTGIEPKLDDAGKPTGIYKYGLAGTKGFFLNGLDDVSVLALFFFMMVFMDTTATIPTGTMCERWAWKSFMLYGLWVALPYCLYANWVWGGGWLAQSGSNWGLGHGAVDFAGSGVVHSMGGIIGLVGAIMIGPRIGKYKDGKPQPIPGHHMPMVVIGTFILAFGWFGFNAGSTMSGTDLRISTVVVNTMLASVTAALGCHLTLTLKGLKPDPSMLCNGMLAGLVAITAPCAFVDTWAAALIGAIAGSLVVFSVFFWEKIGVDDPVGAVSVHGVNGLWGVISLGIFANGKYGAGWNGVDRFAGLEESAKQALSAQWGGATSDGVRGALYGDPSQLWAQLLSAVTVVVFGAVMALVWFKVSDLITPLRVSPDLEMEGLDGPEMGAHGYPDFTVTSRS